MALNETIFITGFPGFIASRLVRRLAAEGARFILLIHPLFLRTAAAELSQIAGENGIDPANFRIVEGDITKPGLGRSVNELERARQETHTILQQAAIYDLAVARGVASQVNVEGTLNVNLFARSV